MKQLMITPSAAVRLRSSGNIAKTSDIVEGTRVAPATPWMARAAISCSGLCERAASREAAPKAVAPITRTLRRPKRSPSDPIRISAPAIRKP